MNEEILKNLLKEMGSLEKSASLFKQSYDKCKVFGIKKTYSELELEAFEALTARFSRLSDLLLQRVFRLIDSLELVNEGTVVDRLNRAEKRKLFPAAKQFVEMKHLRNLIVHEYEPDEYTLVFKNVLNMAEPLLDCVDKTIEYCKKFKI
jgi:hypothetical protein